MPLAQDHIGRSTCCWPAVLRDTTVLQMPQKERERERERKRDREEGEVVEAEECIDEYID